MTERTKAKWTVSPYTFSYMHMLSTLAILKLCCNAYILDKLNTLFHYFGLTIQQYKIPNPSEKKQLSSMAVVLLFIPNSRYLLFYKISSKF